MKEGIIVGSDLSQEWLLSWWWENYRHHNSYPVVFIDFGLSQEAKEWCEARGPLIRLPITDVFVKDRDEVAPELTEQWEREYGENFWGSRCGWFKKPYACLLSPFEKSIWMDLDCEVLGSLQPLFQMGDLALAKDQIITSTYNSGVIVFKKNHPLIQEWARQSLEQNGVHRNDQDLLSTIITEKRAVFHELPQIYNWNVGFGTTPETIVCHWLGEVGKMALRNQLILKEL